MDKMTVKHDDVSESEFEDLKMTGSSFANINLSGSRFRNINFSDQVRTPLGPVRLDYGIGERSRVHLSAGHPF